VKNEKIAQYTDIVNEKDRELSKLRLTLQQAETDKVRICIFLYRAGHHQSQSNSLIVLDQ